ncbi:MAG TPA: TonB-dependent receptor, partial [Rhizomicrobium sp.]|nr:TonB-dependent receptor [Rhizomicrobium sp.]
AKSSLETMEPQTIINQSYIQDSVADTADYTTILAIAPSMSGQDINGPGLSDGNVKNTLRGQPDGNFVMQYDGIPFGDTNGPSHHSESYFPGVTIGSIDVDRGPGNAGNMGAATFGGTVKLYSEPALADSRFTATATYGSWSTYMFNANYQTGDLNLGGMNTRVLTNLEYTGSDGYLTFQNTTRENILLKTQTELAPNWTLTLFANYNGLFQHVNDNNGATAAQINAYGYSFALQNQTSARLGTYFAYNPEGKKTDLDYVRLTGDVSEALHVDDTAYTYAYVNKTISSTNIGQTAADIAAGQTEGLGTNIFVNGVLTAMKNDVPGYTKQNAYRVWGNVFRLARDFDFGGMTGQLRTGIWWESQATQRQRSDFDLTQCLANGCDPWHDERYADASLALLGATKNKAAAYRGGYFEYVEHSNWNQYEPYIELELHPVEGLTVTPGFKYVNWDRSLDAPLEQKRVPVAPDAGSFTTTRDLPFLEVNYKLEPSWSVYAQYAEGIYVPDISAFEQKTPTLVFPKAQTTTNYQVGTVYYSDNWTVDADIYYMGVDNNIVFQACNLPPFTGPASESCALNTGTALYDGIEGETTFAFGDDDFGGVLDGLSLFASGSYNSARSNHLFIKQAPLWTEATGLVYKLDAFKFSLIDKLVGQQYSDTTNTRFYKLGAYNNMDFKASWEIGNFEFGLGLNNVLNARNLLSVGINDGKPIGGVNVYDIASRNSSLDQYYYSPPRSIQVSAKARF